MKYEKLTVKEQIIGLNNRVRQLEEEHYGNSVFIFECEIIGDDASKEDLEAANKGIELRIVKLNEKIEELRATLPKEPKDGETDSV